MKSINRNTVFKMLTLFITIGLLLTVMGCKEVEDIPYEGESMRYNFLYLITHMIHSHHISMQKLWKSITPSIIKAIPII